MSAILSALNQLQTQNKGLNSLCCRWPQCNTDQPRQSTSAPYQRRLTRTAWPALAAGAALLLLLFFAIRAGSLASAPPSEVKKTAPLTLTPDGAAQTAQEQQPQSQPIGAPRKTKSQPTFASTPASASPATLEPADATAKPPYKRAAVPQSAAVSIKKAARSPSAPSDKTKSTDRQDRRARLIASAQRLNDSNIKLQAIAWFDDPKRDVAVINGQMMRQGGSVNGYTVVHLGPHQVILARKNRAWYLKTEVR